jgi:hypothetical protein
VGATALKEYAASIFGVKDIRVILEPDYIGRATWEVLFGAGKGGGALTSHLVTCMIVLVVAFHFSCSTDRVLICVPS